MSLNNSFPIVIIKQSLYFAKVDVDICLPSLNIESFFKAPTDSTEFWNIISSLNLDNSDGPNSIPTRILKLLNKDILSIGNSC